MTMDEFSWSFVCRSLRTDEIHIGDVQVRDEHEKDEVIRYIFLVLCSMPIPWPSHLPSFSSLDDLFGRHKTTDFSYAISIYITLIKIKIKNLTSNHESIFNITLIETISQNNIYIYSL